MHIRTWAIGLFLILGIGLFTVILFLIGNRYDAFGQHVDFLRGFLKPQRIAERPFQASWFPVSLQGKSRKVSKFQPTPPRSSGSNFRWESKAA